MGFFGKRRKPNRRYELATFESEVWGRESLVGVAAVVDTVRSDAVEEESIFRDGVNERLARVRIAGGFQRRGLDSYEVDKDQSCSSSTKQLSHA